jgi:hypothetical protein
VDLRADGDARTTWWWPTARFEWDDLGAWPALARHVKQDAEGNAAGGPSFVHVDSARDVVYDAGTKNRAPITLVGVKDCIVVLADDATLVATKAEAQKIKELVKKLAADPKARSGWCKPAGCRRTGDQGALFGRLTLLQQAAAAQPVGGTVRPAGDGFFLRAAQAVAVAAWSDTHAFLEGHLGRRQGDRIVQHISTRTGSSCAMTRKVGEVLAVTAILGRRALPLSLSVR